MSSQERQFTAHTHDGEIVGWVRGSDPDLPKAVLLHGGPGLSEYMAPLSVEFDGLLTSARYQQRGLAPSEVGGDVSVDGHVADAIALITALGWEKPVVVGHSWGGHLAMHLAVAHPAMVGPLVIVDSLGAVERGGQREFGPNLRRGLSAAQMDRLRELEEIGEPTSDQIREHLGILWPNYFGDPSKPAPMPQTEFAANADQTWASIQAHFRKGTLARRLPRVESPALVIHGERSPIPVHQAARIAQLIPNAQLVVIPGVGHWPWLERPGTMRDIIGAFLDSAMSH
ncbi:MAG TPA: alpha/beta hydrolase [Candidatus Limnocylindrales bacterium]